MVELTGKLIYNVSFTAKGKPIVSLELNEEAPALKMVDELHNAEKLTIKIDKYREKRSLNANNYAWKLLTEIGNRTRQSKEDVYFLMLKRYGQSELISVMAHIPIGEYVKYCEKAGESTLNGKLFKHYRVYKGSSEFDTKEMSIFIDGVVSEAKDLGIQTDTPDQIAKMKDLWGA
jgi:hypothetical protein